MTVPYNPPLVRMEIELCKERLVYHATQYLEGVKDKIEPAVEKACADLINSSWFDEQVEKYAKHAINDSLYDLSKRISDAQTEVIFKRLKLLINEPNKKTSKRTSK